MEENNYWKERVDLLLYEKKNWMNEKKKMRNEIHEIKYKMDMMDQRNKHLQNVINRFGQFDKQEFEFETEAALRAGSEENDPKHQQVEIQSEYHFNKQVPSKEEIQNRMQVFRRQTLQAQRPESHSKRVTFAEDQPSEIKDEALKNIDLEVLLKKQEEYNQQHENLMKEAKAKDLSMKEFGLKMRHHQRNLELEQLNKSDQSGSSKKKKGIVQGIKGFFKMIKGESRSKPTSEVADNYDEFIPFSKSPSESITKQILGED